MAQCSAQSVVDEFYCSRAEVETLHITTGGSLRVENAVGDEAYGKFFRERNDASEWSVSLAGDAGAAVESVDETGPYTTIRVASTTKLAAGDHKLLLQGPDGVRGVFLLLPQQLENSRGIACKFGGGGAVSGWRVSGTLTASDDAGVVNALTLTLRRVFGDGWSASGRASVTSARAGRVSLSLGGESSISLTRRIDGPRGVKLSGYSATPSGVSVALRGGATEGDFTVEVDGSVEGGSVTLELELA